MADSSAASAKKKGVPRSAAESEGGSEQQHAEEDSDEREMSEALAGPDALAPDRVRLKTWNAVALWSWEIEVDSCAICRNLIVELCIECQANDRAGQECARAVGECNHAFHFHCISRWLRTRQVCPLDNQQWEFHNYSRPS